MPTATWVAHEILRGYTAGSVATLTIAIGPRRIVLQIVAVGPLQHAEGDLSTAVEVQNCHANL